MLCCRSPLSNVHECNDVDCCDSISSKEISRPQHGCSFFANPKDLIARGLADSGGEMGPLCQEDGKKRTAKGRRLGTLAQTMAVLTSATDQLIGDAPVSESQVSFKDIPKTVFLQVISTERRPSSRERRRIPATKALG